MFLDTSVVNFILDYGEQIHDGVHPPAGTNVRVRKDIDALYNIFLTGQRATWQLAISPHTYYEIIQTQDPGRFGRRRCWRSITHANDDLPTFIEAEDLRIRILASGLLEVLPDLGDRVLLCDAVVYRCELFCTRDWTTVLKHRSQLKGVPVAIVTPTEWWAKIRPYAGLWV